MCIHAYSITYIHHISIDNCRGANPCSYVYSYVLTIISNKEYRLKIVERHIRLHLEKELVAITPNIYIGVVAAFFPTKFGF